MRKQTNVALTRPWAVRYCNDCRQWERDAGAPRGWVPMARATGQHGHPPATPAQHRLHVPRVA